MSWKWKEREYDANNTGRYLYDIRFSNNSLSGFLHLFFLSAICETVLLVVSQELCQYDGSCFDIRCSRRETAVSGNVVFSG